MGFFEEYFIDPIISGSGYNIYNTLVYALILIAAVFVIFRVMKKMKISIDDKFVLGVTPFVIMGGLLRALEDGGAVSGFWFKTPLIYVVIFALAFATLLISRLLNRKEYHKVWFVAGMIIVIASLTQVIINSMLALGAIIVLSLFWALLLIFIKKVSEKHSKKLAKFFSWENTALLSVHMFDATTTFVAIAYFPYFEQHVLPSFLINIFGPAVMFVLKFVVVAAVLFALDTDIKELEKRKFVKLVIMILGLAPGLRNFFRLIMGV
jgi:uncharacterized membrane protein